MKALICQSARNILLSFLLFLPLHNLNADHFLTPVISIIIDDMGYRGVDDINALKLPGPITYAIMPHAPLSLKVSSMARDSGNSVILHLPMEAEEGDKNRFLGPGGLKLEMNEIQFISTLSKDIQSIPNIIGVNNHMGSLLTRHTQQMEWLMDYLNLRNFFYLDSLTSSNNVTRDIARQKKVPYLRRDIFLDNSRDPDYIDKQFRELIRVAKRNGSAIAIGHPHPETIESLSGHLSKLDEYGVELISLKEMMNARHQYASAKITLLR